MSIYFVPADYLKLMHIEDEMRSDFGYRLPKSFLDIHLPEEEFKCCADFKDSAGNSCNTFETEYLVSDKNNHFLRPALTHYSLVKVCARILAEKITSGILNDMVDHNRMLRLADSFEWTSFQLIQNDFPNLNACEPELELADSPEEKMMVILLASVFQKYYASYMQAKLRKFLVDREHLIPETNPSVESDPLSWNHFAKIYKADAEYQFRSLCRRIFFNRMPESRNWKTLLRNDMELDAACVIGDRAGNLSAFGLITCYYERPQPLSEQQFDEIEQTLSKVKADDEDSSVSLKKIFLYTNLSVNQNNPHYKKTEQIFSEQDIVLECLDGTMLLKYIRNLEEEEKSELTSRFFIPIDEKTEIKKYYQKMVSDFEKKEKERIIGAEPLATAYMEPSTRVSEDDDEEPLPMLDLVESWFSNTTGGVLLLHGQPGDGKTTFCRKAVYEYAKKKRFIDADGVFSFALNDAESHIIEGNDINLEHIFHQKGEFGHGLLTYPDCRKKLIFLDGYDEIKIRLNTTQYNSFDKFFEFVEEKAEDYEVHFVITTRTVAVEDVLKDYSEFALPFLPLSYQQQEDWVLSADWEKYYSEIPYPIYWEKSLKQVCEEKPKGETAKAFYELLQIPFIFRMVVHQAYAFDGGVRNKAKLYEDLFEKTLTRRSLAGITESHNSRSIEDLQKLYRELAFFIWCYNDSMTPYAKNERELLLFSYFMKSGEAGKKKSHSAMIGFIHRSIYQYFLARYLFTGLKEVGENKDKAGELIAKLGSRLLEKDILILFSQIVTNSLSEDPEEKENLITALGTLYSCLADQEGRFPVPSEAAELETVKLRKREREKNILCNVINLGFCLGDKECVEKFNKCRGLRPLLEENKCLKLYINGDKETMIDLTNMNLSGSDMSEGIFSYVNFSGSNLSGSDMSLAELTGSFFIESHLDHCSLKKACLNKSDLTGAKLTYTSMTECTCQDAVLKKADLTCSNLSSASLQGAITEGACFKYATMYGIESDIIDRIRKENECSWANFTGTQRLEGYGNALIPGSLYEFGDYPQDADGTRRPILWRVLEVKEGKALLLADRILDFIRYNLNYENTCWSSSTIREWLNGSEGTGHLRNAELKTFLQRSSCSQDSFLMKAFSQEERRRICVNLTTPDSNPCYETDQGTECRDLLFLLSGKEVLKYFGPDGIEIDKGKPWIEMKGLQAATEPTDYATKVRCSYLGSNGKSIWWLRSVGFTARDAMLVRYDGVVYTYGITVDNFYVGVRPALWISLES